MSVPPAKKTSIDFQTFLTTLSSTVHYDGIVEITCLEYHPTNFVAVGDTSGRVTFIGASYMEVFVDDSVFNERIPVLGVIQIDAGVKCISISSNGMYIIVGGANGKVWFTDLEFLGLRVNNENEYLVVQKRARELWELSKARGGEKAFKNIPTCVALSDDKDTKYAICGYDDGTASFWYLDLIDKVGHDNFRTTSLEDLEKTYELDSIYSGYFEISTEGGGAIQEVAFSDLLNYFVVCSKARLLIVDIKTSSSVVWPLPSDTHVKQILMKELEVEAKRRGVISATKTLQMLLVRKGSCRLVAIQNLPISTSDAFGDILTQRDRDGKRIVEVSKTYFRAPQQHFISHVLPYSFYERSENFLVYVDEQGIVVKLPKTKSASANISYVLPRGLPRNVKIHFSPCESRLFFKTFQLWCASVYDKKNVRIWNTEDVFEFDDNMIINI